MSELDMRELTTRLRELLAKAIPGEWTNDGYRMAFDDGVKWAEIKHDDGYPLRPSPEDLDLIAESHNALPRLLDHIESQDRRIAEMEGLLRNTAQTTVHGATLFGGKS